MNNQKDQSGRIYNSPDNKPATDGTPISSPNGNGGSTQGTMRGGYFVPNK